MKITVSGRFTAALFQAVSKGEHDAIRVLVASGADVNARSGEGLSLLDFAVELGRPATVMYLIREGADCGGQKAEDLVEAATRNGKAAALASNRAQAILARERGDEGALSELAKLRDRARNVEVNAVRKLADRLELVPGTRLPWLNRTKLDEIGLAVAQAGFAPAGEFTAKPLAGVLLRSFVHRDEGAFAIAFEHPKSGLGFEIVSLYADGTVFAVSDGIAVSKYPPRPGYRIERFAAMAPAALWRKALELRPAGVRRSLVPADFVPYYVEAWAKQVAWVKSQAEETAA